MMKNYTFILAMIVGLPASIGVMGLASQPTSYSKVILIIGDGMDDQQITIARNYLVGSQGRLALDDLPYRGAAQVLGIAEDDPLKPVYVSSSANTATAMASGVLTSPSRIGTTAASDEDIVTIMELASSSGIATGIVTTASITDATPASFVAHVSHRGCQSPTTMVHKNNKYPQLSHDCSSDLQARGAKGSIAEQIVSSELDIILGGGYAYFDQAGEATDLTLLALAQSNGFDIIFDQSALSGFAKSARILGLFSPGTMPVMLRGVNGAKAETVIKVEGRLRLPEPFTCELNPQFEGIPTLADMTRAAINHLDSRNDFMLLVESASIDKESHHRRPCGHIGELDQLDDVVRVALNYAESHPETLIIVTGDHGHVAQIVEETNRFAPQNFASPGYFARVRTPEGSVMGVNYASTDFPGWEGHSGVQVPVYASGAGTDKLPTFIRQTDIFHICATHLGLSDSWPIASLGLRHTKTSRSLTTSTH